MCRLEVYVVKHKESFGFTKYPRITLALLFGNFLEGHEGKKISSHSLEISSHSLMNKNYISGSGASACEALPEQHGSEIIS